jgi:hypothetical protein
MQFLDIGVRRLVAAFGFWDALAIQKSQSGDESPHSIIQNARRSVYVFGSDSGPMLRDGGVGGGAKPLSIDAGGGPMGEDGAGIGGTGG